MFGVEAFIGRLAFKGPFGRASAVAKTGVALATLIKWLLW
jgi:hypothetical protein